MGARLPPMGMLLVAGLLALADQFGPDVEQIKAAVAGVRRKSGCQVAVDVDPVNIL